MVTNFVKTKETTSEKHIRLDLIFHAPAFHGIDEQVNSIELLGVTLQSSVNVYFVYDFHIINNNNYSLHLNFTYKSLSAINKV